MPSSVRPRGGSATNRGGSMPVVTPMSERQQLALLMQMTSSTGNEATGSRSPSNTTTATSTTSSRSRERNERGWTPLHEACNHGWYDVAHRLVQSGANVNAKGLDNETPLHDAAANGHVKLVRLLVERGADIHAKNVKGKTPLDVAPAHVQPYLHNPNLPVTSAESGTSSSRLQPRSRDDKKATESGSKKGAATASAAPDEATEGAASKASGTNAEDVYEFKSTKEADSPDNNKTGDTAETEADSVDPLNVPAAQSDDGTKRNFAEVSESNEEGGGGGDDESRRKRRKDEGTKETKTGAQRNTPSKGQGGKQSGGGQSKSATLNVAKTAAQDKKSPCSSPKPAGGGSSTSDAEVEDGKTDLKVPPLKIVIPQGAGGEQEGPTSRNGKNSSQRTHQALPYVVASNSNDGEVTATGSPEGAAASTASATQTKGDEKKDGGVGSTQNEDQRGSHQRVLRSSHRGGGSGGGNATDRGSNNSSPQLQRSHSPSPTASPAAANSQDPPTSASATNTNSTKTDTQASQNDTETTATSATPAAAAAVELHPRKRKMKPNKEPTAPPADAAETPAEAQIHPHDQPITNCYQLFLNIRKQINKRRRGIYPVQPKPPQGFKDYLMNRCTYVLSGTAATTPNISYPPTLPQQMKDLFTEQEKERYRLRMQHVIEKEKLVLSVEQEILRVHGRAARALANQSLPFSVCTILKDEEVYNLITPEQEEKDRNARSRYNGRLFLSWLQDVDDKWEKIKEHMLLRHHNEAESLHAVQKMDWEWKMKELILCDRKSTPSIDEHHVPMVHVSDDFDLLPA
ncbi:ankyrin repeat domain-containing protein 11 isoform X2 [Aethina tumida]|uniref:ankyrin repeat domain-containing protein 11 isoform X2 n=1 Tax=Aethina tumida TaxID=116153 RepID=UPI002147EB39|nr:ankyrin repeat domain-containing protein 11 isoform X2 [Aethina tumida]